jgi:hypothetical protein
VHEGVRINDYVNWICTKLGLVATVKVKIILLIQRHGVANLGHWIIFSPFENVKYYK